MGSGNLLADCSDLHGIGGHNSGQIGGKEDQREGDPGSQPTSEHVQIPHDQEGDNKEVHQDDKPNEDQGSLERGGVIEHLEVRS